MINSKRITAKPAREVFVSMCACTEPVRTGIGAVCVEYGRPMWPITMLNHTNKHTYIQKKKLYFYFWHPMVERPAIKRLFFPKAKMASVASLPRPCLIINRNRSFVERKKLILSHLRIPLSLPDRCVCLHIFVDHSFLVGVFVILSPNPVRWLYFVA